MTIGNKQNAYINGEWAVHVRKDVKQQTSRIRRQMGKKVVRQEFDNSLEGPLAQG